MSPQEKQKLVDAVTKAIAYVENGGKPDIDNLRAGPTGEMKSIFQFLPATWKGYAKDVLGDENAPLNPDNELKVVQGKVARWIDEGKSAGQIASIWNSGSPDKYKQNWKGVTKNGTPYDTPAYAQKVIKYAEQFANEQQAPAPVKPTLPALAVNTQSAKTTPPVTGSQLNNVTTYQRPPDPQFQAIPQNVKPLI